MGKPIASQFLHLANLCVELGCQLILGDGSSFEEPGKIVGMEEPVSINQ
jgi:hypothetical protein